MKQLSLFQTKSDCKYLAIRAKNYSFGYLHSATIKTITISLVQTLQKWWSYACTLEVVEFYLVINIIHAMCRFGNDDQTPSQSKTWIVMDREHYALGLATLDTTNKSELLFNVTLLRPCGTRMYRRYHEDYRLECTSATITVQVSWNIAVLQNQWDVSSLQLITKPTLSLIEEVGCRNNRLRWQRHWNRGKAQQSVWPERSCNLYWPVCQQEELAWEIWASQCRRVEGDEDFEDGELADPI